MSIFNIVALLLLAFACYLLWRILRALEWLCMFAQGFSDSFATRLRDTTPQWAKEP